MSDRGRLRCRSLLNLQEIKHQEAIVEAKKNLTSIQRAVQQWRSKRDVNNCNNMSDSDTENENRKSESCQNLATRDISWTNGSEFRPFHVLGPPEQPVRGCLSDILLQNEEGQNGVEQGVSVGDIFQEASLLLAKGSSNFNVAANMLRSLTPWMVETKHYTTPNQSAVNSPREDAVWQNPLDNTGTGDVRRTSKEWRLQQETDEDLDKMGSLPYTHGRCGIVEVLPTIMEVASLTSPSGVVSSTSLRSFASSSASGDNVVTKNAWITVKKGARLSALSKCTLCERFGSNSKIIFSIDNTSTKYVLSKNMNVAGKRDKNNGENIRYTYPAMKTETDNSSVGLCESKKLFLPPITPSKNCASQTIRNKPHVQNEHTSAISLPPIPQPLFLDRKLHLTNACQADDRRLPPIPSHIVPKKKKRKNNQKNERRFASNVLAGRNKLPPLKPQGVNISEKQVKTQKEKEVTKYGENDWERNNKCEVTKSGEEKTMANTGGKTIHLLVKIPSMDATVLNNGKRGHVSRKTNKDGRGYK